MPLSHKYSIGSKSFYSMDSLMKKHKNIFPLLLYLNTFDWEIV